jgi:hypothetical protein
MKPLRKAKGTGGIPDAFLDELRKLVPVSRAAERHVKLTRSGVEYKGLSPFNEEKNPSFTVNDQKGLFACFSSGKAGDIFDLEMDITGCDFPEAVAIMAGLAGVPVPGKGPTKMDSARGKATQPRHDDSYPEDRSGSDPNDRIYDIGTPDQRPIERAEKKAPVKREIVRTYDYLDQDGLLAYQVVRYEPKTFSQRRPYKPEPGKWVWGLTEGAYVRKRGGDWLSAGGDRTPDKGFVEAQNFKGTEHGLYHFPQLLEELAQDPSERAVIWMPEGEKDVETLEGLGFVATTNSGGAKNWHADHAALFEGCDIIVPVDGDKPGRERGEMIAASLHAARAKRVRVLELPAVEDEHGMPKKGSDITDWTSNGGTKDELFKIISKLAPWQTPDPVAYPSKFGAIPMARIWDEAEPYEWLIKGILPMRERVLIYGEPQSGKSFFALDLAMAVARGADLRGCKTRKAGVIYCAFEGGKGFRNRVKGYFLGHDLPRDPNVPFVILTRDADLFGSEDVVKDMIEEIKHWVTTMDVPLGLIVFDTISACTPGMNENAGEEIGRFLGHARQIGQETEATIMLVHHKPKQGDTPRGSGKLTGDLETTIEIGFPPDGAHDENDRPIRIMKIKKQRESEAGKEHRFVLRKIDVAKDSDGDGITTCICLPPGGVERPKAAMGFALRAGNETILVRSLLDALSSHGIVPPDGYLDARGNPLPSGIRVVKISEVKKAYMAADIGHDDDDAEGTKALARVNKAINRDGGRLRSHGVINWHIPFMWWTGKVIRDMKETHPVEAIAPQVYQDDGHDALALHDAFGGEHEHSPF